MTMRILFISNLYPPHDLGGWEQNCQEIVERLQARDHTCQVITSRYGMEGASSQENGVTRALYLEADVHYYRPLDFFLKRPWQERANRHALRCALDTFKPDAVFIWGMWNLSRQVAYWAEQWLPGRVAIAVAGYWPIEPGVHESYWQLPARRPWAETLKSFTRYLALRTLARERQIYSLSFEQVACVSDYVRSKLAAAGALPHGARVIYNGINPQPFLQAALTRKLHCDEMRLVYVGGLIPQKGVLTAIEALGLLQQRSQADKLRLTVVGGGHPDYEARLQRRVAELDLNERVIFRGRVPREQIADILASHDVFLFTSVYEEPIARTVMEAMATELVVVGSEVGGQVEMLADGENSLTFQPGDAEGLARQIQRLLDEPELPPCLAEAGKKMVLERFTLERMVGEMEVWLEGIVA